MLAWRDGDWLNVPDAATVEQLAPGPSLFETFALRAGRVVALADHLARLAQGCARFGLDPARLRLGAAPDPALWSPIVRKLLARAELTDAIFRLIVIPDGVGGAVEWLTVRPLPATPPSLSLRLLRTVRDEPEWLPRPKSGPWRNSAAALRELAAVADTNDTEGLQCDARGHLSEGPRSSLAWLESGRWYCPAAATGRLPGTAAAHFRAVLVAAGREVGEVAAPLPMQATAWIVLRSTFVDGGVPAHEVRGVDGGLLWQPPASAPEAHAMLAALAAARAQRCMNLL
jgi:branched-subunit amino acid aminotransferase/4-amino-4-deoxychorismate lyase